MTDRIHSVSVLGTGVLGSQIIFQTAYSGYPVVAYDAFAEALDKLPKRWEELRRDYLRDVPDASDAKIDEAIARITPTDDITKAAQSDLVIEAVPEVLDIKRDTYEKLGKAAPETTIFASNSSTMMPSQMVDATGRPDRFLALHFANHIWKNNIAEVMRQDATSDDVYEAVVEFADSIGMVPVRVLKEQPGYVLNSLLVPLLNAAAGLYVKGVATPETIDQTWRIGTGAPRGPFEIFDIIGLNTPYNLAKSRAAEDPGQAAWAEKLKTFIDAGKLGVGTGEGFYKYDAEGNKIS